MEYLFLSIILLIPLAVIFANLIEWVNQRATCRRAKEGK